MAISCYTKNPHNSDPDAFATKNFPTSRQICYNVRPRLMHHKHGTWQANRSFSPLSAADLAAELELPTKFSSQPRLLIGRNEWIAFPDLNIPPIIAKSDSGARTSTLHAEQITVSADGKSVSFCTRDRDHQLIPCHALIAHSKKIKSSTGHKHPRIVITTTALFPGGLQCPIELTLANRSRMKYPVLLGRRAMSGYFCIDPQSDYLLGGLAHFPQPSPTPPSS